MMLATNISTNPDSTAESHLKFFCNMTELIIQNSFMRHYLFKFLGNHNKLKLNSIRHGKALTI